MLEGVGIFLLVSEVFIIKYVGYYIGNLLYVVLVYWEVDLGSIVVLILDLRLFVLNNFKIYYLMMGWFVDFDTEGCRC